MEKLTSQSLSWRQWGSNYAIHVNAQVTIGAYGTPAHVQPLAPMAARRAFCSSVVLPDGSVLVVGGQVNPDPKSLNDEPPLMPHPLDVPYNHLMLCECMLAGHQSSVCHLREAVRS